ncbi:unnamed protein product, partial [marine sediment metagenome]
TGNKIHQFLFSKYLKIYILSYYIVFETAFLL